MTTNRPLFTIFTPTYNRAHTLQRTYSSLLEQTWRDFEWLIVDDGSQDGTIDLVQAWIDERRIAIRYIRQPNSGKHVAFNRGVRQAHGELLLTLDSDDTCEPNALERFRWHWLAIPDSERDRFSGITCLFKDEHDSPIGGPLPQDKIDGRPCEVMSRCRRKGEMWGFHRTEVLRGYPFPAYPGERFVPEGLVWNRIGHLYMIRFVNEALRCYHDSPDSLSGSMVRIRTESPRSTLVYYAEALALPLHVSERIRSSVNIWRFAVPGGLASQAWGVRANRALVVAGLLPGLTMAIVDKLLASTLRSSLRQSTAKR